MARSRRRIPARPLTGYRDVGGGIRYSKRHLTRTWIILAFLIALYLTWTLLVYFLEPGLR